jgi:hypothetical protein
MFVPIVSLVQREVAARRAGRTADPSHDNLFDGKPFVLSPSSGWDRPFLPRGLDESHASVDIGSCPPAVCL